MNKKIFYRCACFFKTNIYLEQIATHVHYTNDQQFRDEYQNVRNIFIYTMTNLRSSSWQHLKLILKDY
jgi:hypothetical protein